MCRELNRRFIDEEIKIVAVALHTASGFVSETPPFPQLIWEDVSSCLQSFDRITVFEQFQLTVVVFCCFPIFFPLVLLPRLHSSCDDVLWLWGGLLQSLESYFSTLPFGLFQTNFPVFIRAKPTKFKKEIYLLASLQSQAPYHGVEI